MKVQLREWLVRAEFHNIVNEALTHRRTLSTLITLTYDADALICWRALDAIERCAARLCTVQPEALKKVLRRLFWLMTDESGAIAWHAPEAIGGIIRSDPSLFSDFIPMTVSLLDMEQEDRPPFLPGILYALGRIGEVAPGAVKESIPGIIDALTDTDSQARAMAVWALRSLGEYNLLSQHPELEHDRGEATIYRNGRLKTTTVGGIWAETPANNLKPTRIERKK